MDKIKVALIKCDNYELSEVKSAINRGIDLLGGIDLFVKEGDKILLKPNLLASESAEKSVTTHPVVFEAIISILQEIKEKKNIKKISYGDSPGIGKGISVAQKSGISEVAEKSGYSDQYYFSKVFKKFFSVSPSAFRKNNTVI